MTMVRIDFARQLERELNDLKEEFAIAVDGWKFAQKDRDEWKAIAEELAASLRDKTQIPNTALARFNAKKGKQ